MQESWNMIKREIRTSIGSKDEYILFIFYLIVFCHIFVALKNKRQMSEN